MKEIKFDDFVRLNRGFDLPDSKIEEGPYPVVASTSIKAYHKEYKLNPPVVVTGRSGTLGKVQYIEEKCWPLNTSLYSKDFRGNYPLYVYYFLQTMHLEQYNAGAGVPTLNQNHLHGLKIKIHDIDEQKKVADSLFAFDKALEINNKRIRLLNEMADNLYREWFTRFRFPGYEHEKYTDSKLGKIPASFRIVKMKDVFESYIGGGWGSEDKNKDYSEGAFVIRGADFPSVIQGDLSTCPYRFHKKSNIRTRILEAGDIVIEISGGTAEQPVGRAIIIDQRMLDRFSSPVMCASFCKLVRLNKQIIDPFYFYYWMKFLYDTRIIDRFQLQSTGIINFKFEYFLNKGEVLLPPLDLMAKFADKVNLLIEEKNIIAEKNSILTRQRELLLPRLMSGKIMI